MEGSAKIISLIARDESQHLALTQKILYKWQKGDDPEMQEIAEEEKETVRQMFLDAVFQEKEWAKYLFENGSMIGLNERLLSQYVEWVANRRMKAIGLTPAFDIPAKNNPLPWTEHWLNSKGQQNAPQETEIESYVVGGIKQDVSAETFSGFKLLNLNHYMARKKWKRQARSLYSEDSKVIGAPKTLSHGIRDHLSFLRKLKKDLKNTKPIRNGRKR